MAKSLDHVCVLVKDINQAIEHYRSILSAVTPGILEQGFEITEALGGEDRFLSVVFNALGDGCNIQLIQPINPESPLHKRLERHGEHIHHIAFTSSHLETTVQLLIDEGVSLHPGGKQLLYDVNNPTTGWTWISPQYAHGALIEIMDAGSS